MVIGDTSIEARRGGSLARTTLFVLFGPIVWAIHFTILYGAHTIACARLAAGDAATLIVLGATAGALAPLLGAASIACRRRNTMPADAVTPRFCYDIALVLTLLSAAGVAWAGATALIMAPCVALR
jgi:hypothetical protein